MNICVICETSFDEYPNNAFPIDDGVCCNECNEEEVIPYRLELAYLADNIVIEKNIPIPPLEFQEDDFELMLNEIGLTIINNHNHN